METGSTHPLPDCYIPHCLYVFIVLTASFNGIEQSHIHTHTHTHTLPFHLFFFLIKRWNISYMQYMPQQELKNKPTKSWYSLSVLSKFPNTQTKSCRIRETLRPFPWTEMLKNLTSFDYLMPISGKPRQSHSHFDLGYGYMNVSCHTGMKDPSCVTKKFPPHFFSSKKNSSPPFLYWKKLLAPLF